MKGPTQSNPIASQAHRKSPLRHRRRTWKATGKFQVSPSHRCPVTHARSHGPVFNNRASSSSAMSVVFDRACACPRPWHIRLCGKYTHALRLCVLDTKPRQPRANPNLQPARHDSDSFTPALFLPPICEFSDRNTTKARCTSMHIHIPGDLCYLRVHSPGRRSAAGCPPLLLGLFLARCFCVL